MWPPCKTELQWQWLFSVIAFTCLNKHRKSLFLFICCKTAWHQCINRLFNKGWWMTSLDNLHVFVQWLSGTWQGSNTAGFHKEPPSIWSKTPPGTKVKSCHYQSLVMRSFKEWWCCVFIVSLVVCCIWDNNRWRLTWSNTNVCGRKNLPHVSSSAVECAPTATISVFKLAWALLSSALFLSDTGEFWDFLSLSAGSMTKCNSKISIFNKHWKLLKQKTGK